jgi:hypothetical protein
MPTASRLMVTTPGRQDVGEHQTVPPQHDQRALDVADRPLTVGEAIPAVCTIGDLARVMRISMATAYRRKAAGHLKPFELLPRVGHPRYSGALLTAWQERSTQGHINGEFNKPRVFGRRSA